MPYSFPLWLTLVMPAMRQEERQSFSERLLRKAGLVDVFRAQHPDVRGYTYWHYFTKARERNAGWRIDYFLVRGVLLCLPRHPRSNPCRPLLHQHLRLTLAAAYLLLCCRAYLASSVRSMSGWIFVC